MTRFDPAEDPRRAELISMLGGVAAQIQAALREVEAPASTLVTVAHSLSKSSEVIARCVFDFSGSPARVFQDLITVHDEMHANSAKATTAVQFHDRLVQCLSHVCESLAYLAEYMSRDRERQSTAEWEKLQLRVRATLSMENERIVFDMSKNGANFQEVKTAIAQEKSLAGQVELF